MKRTLPSLEWLRRRGRPARPGTGPLVVLSLDGRRLEAVQARRTNGSMEVLKSVRVTLALDPQEADPGALGREIRQHLDAAGIRERHCVMALPLSWLFSLSFPLPELPEADLESLIQLEAERGFPASLDTLQVARSRYRLPSGAAGVTLLGLGRQHLDRLEAALRAAHLRPLSLTVGLAALPGLNGKPDEGILILQPGEQGVELQVACGGGLALVRTLTLPAEETSSPAAGAADPLIREIRITLGQLPPPVGESIRRLRVVGDGPEAERIAARLRERPAAAGLPVEWWHEPPGEFQGVRLPPGVALTPALAVAARHLAQQPPALEFLPPRVSRWQALLQKFAPTRRLAAAGAATAGIVLLVILALAVQQIRLSYWRVKWNSIRAEVTALEKVQQQVRQFRPWYDESFRSLSILKRLTEAFPEDGAVSAKSVEIRPGSTGVTCSGTARDNAALLRTLDKLRAMPEVRNLKVEQIRGSAPMQFTVNFRWADAGPTP